MLLFFQIRRADCVLDVTIKDKAFRLIRVYGPNVNSELPAFFLRSEPYVIASKRVILVGDWNALLDLNLDRVLLVRVLTL